MILVTGGGGKTAQAVIEALLDAELPVRAWVWRAEQTRLLELLGIDEIVIGDLRETRLLQRAVNGAEAIYHICPNVHPDEVAIGRELLTAASAADCRHFVFHSVLHPQTEAMAHHWRKLRVEESLLASGLPFTILRPAPYMQNLLPNWYRISQLGVYSVPYPATTRITQVDLLDVATVAATVLSEPGHVGATYDLCGPDYLSQEEVAATISRQLGREVRVSEESIADWTERARSNGLDDERIETLCDMFRYYERHGLRGNPRTLHWLLDRPPTSFQEFIARVERRHAVDR